MTSVALATPHGGLVSPEFYRALLTMQGQWPQHFFTHIEVDTMIVAKARNILVETARLQEGIEVIWFIDNDVLIPPDSGVLVDQALQLGIVSGMYFARRPPYLPQVYDSASEQNLYGMYWPLTEYPESGMGKHDAVGFGCVAVRMDIFETMRKYHTQRFAETSRLLSEADLNAEYIVRNLSPWFEFLERKGEDLYFCERAREIGQDIWVNYDVKCAHMAEIGIREEHFKQLYDTGLVQRAPIGSAVDVEGVNI